MVVAARRHAVEEVEAFVATGADFDAMYRHEYPILVRLAYALCGRRDVAEELVQDAMAKTLARWSRVREYDSPGAFVRRVLLHDISSTIRRRRVELKTLIRFRGSSSDEWMVDPDVDEFWRLVRALPTRQAQVVALYYGDQQSTVEIAELFDLSEGTVRATLAHARDALRAQLKEEDR